MEAASHLFDFSVLDLVEAKGCVQGQWVSLNTTINTLSLHQKVGFLYIIHTKPMSGDN